MISAQKQGYLEALASYKNVLRGYQLGQVGIEHVVEQYQALKDIQAKLGESMMEQMRTRETGEQRLLSTRLRAQSALLDIRGGTPEERRALLAAEGLRNIEVFRSRMGQLRQGISNIGSGRYATAFEDLGVNYMPAQGRGEGIAGVPAGMPPPEQKPIPRSQIEYIKALDEYKKKRSEIKIKDIEKEYNEYIKTLQTYSPGPAVLESFADFAARRMPKAPVLPKDVTGWVDMRRAREALDKKRTYVGEEITPVKPQKVWTEVTGQFKIGAEALADGIESALPNLEKFAQIMQELGKPQQTMAMESYSASLDHMQRMVRTLPTTAAVQIQVEYQNMELRRKQADEALRNYRREKELAGGRETERTMFWKKEAQTARQAWAQSMMELGGGIQGRLEAEFDKFNTRIEAFMPRSADLARAAESGAIPFTSASPFLHGRILRSGERAQTPFYRSMDWYTRGMHPLESTETPWWLKTEEAALPRLGDIYANTQMLNSLSKEAYDFYQKQAEGVNEAVKGELTADRMKDILEKIFHGSEPLKVAVVSSNISYNLPPAVRQNL